ncbi:helix-turn-helix domain-containing protein [Streptomyces sp. URMC 129]|uniref:helix-turn-helix domain-containing protein n=1 Tax=Streptomyces sp. URMC 129 TaxID=3423407 RepID=UPI003F1B7F1C
MANSRPKPRSTTDERPAIWVGYGKLTKLLRERAKLTQEQLAEAVGYSFEQISSIERGRRPAKTPFTEAAERVLDAGGVLLALQEEVDLARLPRFFLDFALLEAEALSRFSYDPLLVPGLLQTEEYARALLTAHFPPFNEDTIEERVAGRLARQSLLRRDDPAIMFVFVIEEAVLHRMVGGTEVMRRQYQRLLECCRARNIEVQIMPSSRAVHCGLNGPMVLLETLDRRQFVYVEVQDIVSFQTDREEVSSFWLRYGMLRSQALNSEESAKYIERIAGEL